MSLLKKYQDNLEFLSRTEKECFTAILKKNYIDKEITIKKLAEENNVSTTTIFRMIKNLGYESFKYFRYDLIYEKREKLDSNGNEDHILNQMENDIKESIELLRNINIDDSVDAILKARKVMICGTGMNTYIANMLELKLNLYNINATSREDNWFMYLETSNLTEEDVVIIISKTGETKILIDIAKNIKLNGAKIIYLGEWEDSTISNLADYKIVVTKSREYGVEIDSRLQIHLAVYYLTKSIIRKKSI